VYPETRVHYINQPEKEAWENWKEWKDCTEEEKRQCNLREIFPNEIVIDVDPADKATVETVKEKLSELKWNYYLCSTGSRGHHIHIYFSNMLEQAKKELRDEIRRHIIVNWFKADWTKNSDKTVVSMVGKPHFKTGNMKKCLERKDGMNDFPFEIIEIAQRELIKKEEQRAKNRERASKDTERFKDYHLKDRFFRYISANVIGDGKYRNNIVFPNLAIALVREGLSNEEIKDLMAPIIKKNFPGKTYNEFVGWVGKARNGTIVDYNEVQINQWIQQFMKENTRIYEGVNEWAEVDIPMRGEHAQTLDQALRAEGKLEEAKSENPEEYINGFKVYWDPELKDLENIRTEWLVEDWIPIGDICFLVGKAASFKTTLLGHLGYCVSEGKMFVNKYEVRKGRVLYLNEENSNNIMMGIIRRVKKGLTLDEVDCNDIAFTMLEGILLGNKDISQLKKIAEWIKENDINVLMIDSFRRFIDFDENNATEMNRFFKNLNALRKYCDNLTIIILHHLKKNVSESKGETDIRDMLRGSSDIVNSADSIIGIERKTGKDMFVMRHIKNRAGIEVQGKVIFVNCGDKDTAYFYESEEVQTIKKAGLTKKEKVAEQIVRYCEDNDIKTFKRGEAETWLSEDAAKDTLKSALKLLEDEGTIIGAGQKKSKEYVFNAGIPQPDEPQPNPLAKKSKIIKEQQTL
jgi:RecA-family ATPase